MENKRYLEIIKTVALLNVDDFDDKTFKLFKEYIDNLALTVPDDAIFDYDYDGKVSFKIKRLETNEEYNDRIQKEKEREEFKEKALYEKLKAKYENK